MPYWQGYAVLPVAAEHGCPYSLAMSKARVSAKKVRAPARAAKTAAKKSAGKALRATKMAAGVSKVRTVKASVKKTSSLPMFLWNVTPSPRAGRFIDSLSSPEKARKFLKAAGMPVPQKSAA